MTAGSVAVACNDDFDRCEDRDPPLVDRLGRRWFHGQAVAGCDERISASPPAAGDTPSTVAIRCHNPCVELQRLEARVIGIAESVLAGRKVEDDRVELKRIWPTDIYKTARQIAGHSNASRGEPILWIIGLDEGNHEVVANQDEEIANWWPEITRWFDGDAPVLSVLSVPVGVHQRVTALRFDTSRAPYVISTESGGRVAREVPWRVGNSTRTAHRHELLASLVAEATVPELELVSGRIEIEFLKVDKPVGPPPERPHELRLEAVVFLSAADHVFLPQHRQSWRISVPGIEPVSLWVHVKGSYRLGAYTQMGAQEHDQIGNIEVHDRSGMDIHSSGEITVRSRTPIDETMARAVQNAPSLTLTATLPIDRSTRSAALTTEFFHITGSERHEQRGWRGGRILAAFEARSNS